MPVQRCPGRPGPSSREAAAIAAATAPDRDRYVDALRVSCLLVVALGHWLMGALTPQGQVTNTLDQLRWLQPATWILQVMAVFFLVGGVAPRLHVEPSPGG